MRPLFADAWKLIFLLPLVVVIILAIVTWAVTVGTCP